MIHTLNEPVTVTENRVIWKTACGIQVALPKQRYAIGVHVQAPVAGEANKNEPCPQCFAEQEERRDPTVIEAEQRQGEERPQPTFDDSIGAIEQDGSLGEAFDDQLLSEESDEYPST